MGLKQKILIVDDKPENLYALEKVLGDTGAEIVKARSGNDALAATLHHEFALAILDVQMPGMDGYELAELLRGDDKTRDLPIVFLTAVYSDERHVFQGYEAGAMDFVTKPYNPKLLLSKVGVYLKLDKQKRDRVSYLEKMRSLIDLSAGALAEASAQGLLQRMVDAARELTGSQAGTAGYGYRDGVFRMAAVSAAENGEPCPPWGAFSVPGGGVLGDLMGQGRPIRLTAQELRDHPVWRGLSEGCASPKGLLIVPLMGAGGRPTGLIMVSGKKEGELTEEDEALLGQLASLTSLGLQQIDAREEAERKAAEAEEGRRTLKQVQEALKLSEELFRRTFDQSPLGAAIVALDFGLKRVNDALCQITRYSKEELLTLSLSDITDRDDFDETRKNTGRLLAGAIGRYQDEIRYLQKGGEIIWVNLTLSLMRDADGQPLHLLAKIEDITDRKRMESALRKAYEELETRVQERTAELQHANVALQLEIDERRRVEAALREEYSLRKAIEHSLGEGIVAVDRQGRQSYVNPAFCRMVGWSEEELLGKMPPFAYWPDEDKEKLGEIFRATILGAIPPRRLETRFARSNGERFDVSVLPSPFMDQDGGPLGWIASVADITEKKRTEDLLQRTNRALKTLGECNQAVVQERDESELFDRVCRIITEVGGYRMAWVGLAEQDEKKSIRPAAYAGYEEGYLDSLDITWDDAERGRGPTGTAVRTGLPHISKDIRTHPQFDVWRAAALERGYASSISLPLKVGGCPYGALTIYAPEPEAFDAEEVKLLLSLAENLSFGIAAIQTRMRRKQAEEELKAYMKKLEESNQALQDFASIASHDMQEPLRKIIAFGDQLKRRCDTGLDNEGRDYLDRMQKAAVRMKGLLQSLLDYSRVTTKTEPFARVDLTRLVLEVVEDLEVRIEQTGGRVEVAGLPTVEVDPYQMRQLFQNLMGNSLKFCRGAPPLVRVSGELTDRKRYCKIVVEDNGIGFDEKYLDRIFSPFQRLHGRSAYEGSGMGLAICRKIVERHGGTISARSSPGKGSTFIVTLPVRQSEGECAP